MRSMLSTLAFVSTENGMTMNERFIFRSSRSRSVRTSSFMKSVGAITLITGAPGKRSLPSRTMKSSAVLCRRMIKSMECFSYLWPRCLARSFQ
jgi:hypothetical protein